MMRVGVHQTSETLETIGGLVMSLCAVRILDVRIRLNSEVADLGEK